jgi:putative membrane protein
MSTSLLSEKPWRRSLITAACIASQALAFGALAQQTDESRPRQSTSDRGTSTDMTRTTNAAMSKTVSPQSFAAQAALIGKAEIELGQLAAARTQDQNVRDYAARMVKDHTAADTKLKKIADRQNLQLPQSLDGEHEALKTKLASLQGAAFDKEYAKAMAKGHDKAVALFEAAAQNSQMPSELKEFAASTLPTLKKHDELAHSLHDRAGS